MKCSRHFIDLSMRQRTHRNHEKINTPADDFFGEAVNQCHCSFGSYSLYVIMQPVPQLFRHLLVIVGFAGATQPMLGILLAGRDHYAILSAMSGVNMHLALPLHERGDHVWSAWRTSDKDRRE